MNIFPTTEVSHWLFLSPAFIGKKANNFGKKANNFGKKADFSP
jgi:hypothetical protein